MATIPQRSLRAAALSACCPTAPGRVQRPRGRSTGIRWARANRSTSRTKRSVSHLNAWPERMGQ